MLGRPIRALHFLPPSYAQPRPAAVLLGALHGDDPLGVYCLGRLCEDLVERPPGRETWIIPALDIDGLAAGTKNNAGDVDLDRNFAATTWTATHTAGYFPGRAPESEPETRALVALIEHSHARRLLVLRSPRGTITWAGAGLALAEDMARLDGYSLRAAADHPVPGSFEAKYGTDQGREVVTIDIPFLDETEAWLENRAALRFALDLPT